MECSLEKITVHYEEFGEGKPLVFLPGWGLNARWTAYEAEPYFHERTGWKRFYIDPPGHGKTPGKDWITNQDAILDVVLDCVDQLTGGKRFCLIGHSLGAYLARGVLRARMDLVDGIAMLVPVIYAEDGKRTLPPHHVLVEDPSIRAEIKPEEEFLLEISVVHSRKWLDYQRSFPELPEQEMGDFEFLNKIRTQAAKYAFSFDPDDLPEPFPRPALLVSGRQDAIAGYQDAWALLEKYPRATYAVLDRAGHPLEEKTDLVKALINDWLDRVEESAVSE